jgi:hypothetical protein
MNIERARVLWKKSLPYLLAAFTLGAVGTVAAKRLSGDSCCKPGAACCYPGSPCCHHADRVSQR